jgi:predicted cupin superfamily sugar epimerase
MPARRWSSRSPSRGNRPSRGGSAAGEVPQAVVPAHAWQAARSLGDWTLLGCTVAPGFVFDRFELAAPDWTPEQN